MSSPQDPAVVSSRHMLNSGTSSNMTGIVNLIKCMYLAAKEIGSKQFAVRRECADPCDFDS